MRLLSLCALMLPALAWAQATVNESLETAFLYVDTYVGSDSNPGTQAFPLQTISAAAAIALANNRAGVGTQVIINPGIYRESITIGGGTGQTAMPMTFQAATSGTVTVSGAIPYPNWATYTANPNIYTNTWPYRWGFCTADGGNAPPEQPIVLRREMVFIGGVPMTEVLSLNQMVFPGTFFVDETGGVIYVWPPAGTDMSAAAVEVSTIPNVLTINNMSSVVIRGITFANASSCHSDQAVIVTGNSSNILFDSDNFLWNGGQAVTFATATNVTVTNTTANHNGSTGFNAVQVKNFSWQNIAASYNNWRGAQGAYYSWGTGGAHLFSNHDETINGFNSTYNQTFGMHWDTDTQNVTVTNVLSSHNMLAVEDEKGQGPLTVGNSAFCNGGQYGFMLRDSEFVTLNGNTWYNNASSAIFLTGVLGGLQITNWETGQIYNLVTQNLTLTNNVIDAVGASQQVFADGVLGGNDWTVFQATLNSDYNTWWNASNSNAFSVPVPQTSTAVNFSGWQSYTGQDTHSAFAPPTVDPSAACAVTVDAPDWWLTVDNGVLTTDPAGNAVFNLLNTPLGGWMGPVTLALDGVPAIPGATAGFSFSSISANGTSALTFNAGPSTPPGTYTFTVLGNSGNVTRTVTLSVTVPVTSVRLSATSLTFNNQPVGTTSSPQTITVTNTGTSALGISSIASSYTFFTQTNTCGTSLAAGQSCTIAVTFTPQNLQPSPGTLTITDSDGTSPQIVTLAGTSVGSAKGCLTPGAFFFANQVFLSPSAPVTTTLTNCGTADLTLNSTSIGITGTNSADFSQTNNCGPVVSANTSCTITVAFTPQYTGARAANLSITSNATNSPETAQLNGNGTTAIAVSPKSVGFGNVNLGQTSPTHTVTIANLSTATLAMGPFSLSGTNPGDFSQTTNCTSTLAGGTSCTITVTMAPKDAGSLTANLNINDSDPTSPQTVALSGTGNTTATVTLLPKSLAFGNAVYLTPSAPQAATLTNTGTSAVNITSITPTGTNPSDFSQTNNCGSSLAIGASCTVNVAFTPTSTGPRMASISITDGATGSPQTVSLSGSGTTGISVSARLVGFGTVSVGTTSPVHTVTITSLATATLTMSPPSITGTNPGDFSLTTTCGAALAGHASCVVNLTMSPQAAGARSATLNIVDSDPTSPQLVTLSGTGSASPVATLSPKSLAFGNVVYLTPSAVQTATLSNTGNAPLSISSIAPAGTNPGDFNQTNNCASSLAAGASCTINVTFAPMSTGTRMGSISITDNAGGSPQALTLSGSGTTAISVSAKSVGFGTVSLGTTSPVKTVTITNLSTATLTLSPATITGSNPGEFSQTTTCGTTLARGGSCTISLTMTPQATGARTGTLNIIDSDPTSPQTVALSGTGSASPIPTVSPKSLAFGNVVYLTPSATQTVSLTNTGNAAMSITSITVTGTNPGDYSETNNCGSSLGAGASCTVIVTFTPLSTGTRSASLAFTDNAGGSPQTVKLGGSGTTAISVNPKSLGFGTVSVGNTSPVKTVSITNLSTAMLTMSPLTIGGVNPADFSQTSTCGTTLAGGAACTASVTMSPQAAGARTATLTIADSDPTSPQLVALSGTGSASPVVALSPTSLALGNVIYLNQSAVQSTTLTNTGNAPLIITSIALTGTNNGDFNQSGNNCGSSLAAGSNCVINVTFTPTALGRRTASVTITDNAQGSPHNVSLSGTGFTSVSFTPQFVAFPSTKVGNSSIPSAVTLTNLGVNAISITGITIGGTNSGRRILAGPRSRAAPVALSTSCLRHRRRAADPVPC
jgi:Abnormal spindle-like microcephaly-assoc'd, ASPM-SPD-2-Hydin